ncbi:MAG: tRNA (adenosine(37)-N6)-threonylcarbamoyltransferase complex transferase subunit TsaD [bacterium]|nr:tRNA (adenosine(37)-N6)-threonylcarbamoyltransferase complex transferase subunit TsaD [bacterium]
MKILAIETSCDETAAAVLFNDTIKSNIVASQAKLHSKFGGVVPEVAAREHVPAMIPTIELALKTAKTKLKNIDYIAVTQGPGLVTSLMVGINTAQTLAVSLNKPLIPINHMEAHIYANFVTDHGSRQRRGSPKAARTTDPFPALVLVVSGGHTMLVLMQGHGKYKIIGETVDDAAGEAFDKTAKILGLPYPGGPHLSKLALKGDPKAFVFPRPMINSNNLNFSFSGLKTAVLYEVKKHKTLSRKRKSNFAASIEQAIVDVLIAKTKRAIKKYHPKTIMLGGGVAANKKLRKEFISLGKRLELKASIPAHQYCTDNAAMIGLAAYYKLQTTRYKLPTKSFQAEPNLDLGIN